MNPPSIGGQGPSRKRKRKPSRNDAEVKPSTKAPNGSAKSGEVVKIGQLAWKKVSLLDDEFDDFEEIEGVDVEYVGGDSGKVVQFKVVNERKQQPKKPKKSLPVKSHEDPLVEEEWHGIKDTAEDVSAQGEQSASQNPFQQPEDLPLEFDLPGWSTLTLSMPTLQALQSLGFTSPTPIQSLAIPKIMKGHDLIGKASTGSGKTLAFGIPILEHVLSLPDARSKAPTALVVAPTRELAKQIVSHLEDIAKFSLGAMTVFSVTGGLSVEKQIRLLKRKPSVIVGTPGRLWDVFSSPESKSLGLEKAMKEIQFLVLDEADRLLQDGHFAEIEKILDFVNGGEGKHTLVFSATFQKELQQKLKRKNFEENLLSQDDALEFLLQKLRFREKPPEFVDANPETAVASQIVEAMIQCDKMEKDLFLYYFLLRYPGRTLVFVNSIDAVRRIVPLLTELRLPAIGLHSQLRQKQRLQGLERFKASSNAILIATDVAARGLDIPSVQHVVHYHLPRATDTYIHRSGRTARGTEQGVSILLCCPEEQKPLRQMVMKLDKSKFLSKMPDIFPVHRIIVSKLRHRVDLAQKVVNASLEVQRKGKEEKFFAEAADELGVDTEELGTIINSKGKYGKQRTDQVSKRELQSWKNELQALLAQPVQVGFNPKYPTSGSINYADLLLKGKTHKEFLGVDISTALEDLSKRAGSNKT